MSAEGFIDPKDFIDPQVEIIDGQKFIVSRLPAFDAAPVYDSIVEYRGTIPQADKITLLSRCAYVTDDGKNVVLNMPTLINTYIKKFQTLQRLIDKAVTLNFDFSSDGSPSQD